VPAASGSTRCVHSPDEHVSVHCLVRAPSTQPHEYARGAHPQACINQLDIDSSLASLPIFLMGCQELLVLVGLTYPTRLWCTSALGPVFGISRLLVRRRSVWPVCVCHPGVMEIFVFVRAGGHRDNINLRLLDDTNSEFQKLLLVLHAIDAAKARCFVDADRQRLLAIIEASFGTCSHFNTIVHGILQYKLTGKRALAKASSRTNLLALPSRPSDMLSSLRSDGSGRLSECQGSAELALGTV
jgi:hypothetical protein